MTDQIMMELAKLQTENRNLKQDIKKSTQLLLQRDDEKTELQKEINKRQQLILTQIMHPQIEIILYIILTIFVYFILYGFNA